MELKPRTPLVYVLYVPGKEQVDVLKTEEFKRINSLVVDSQVTAIFSSLNYEVLDRAIEQGFRFDHIFSHIHKRSFRSVRRVWVAGRGSSVYARAVISTALSRDYDIPVSNYTPSEGCLGSYIRMLQRGTPRRAYLVGEKLGLMLPG